MKTLIFLVFYLQIAAYDSKLPCLINKQLLCIKNMLIIVCRGYDDSKYLPKHPYIVS